MRKIMRKFIPLALSAAVTVSGINAGKLYVMAEDNDEKSVSVTEINYDDLTITIKGNEDKNYYISDSQQRVWENINGVYNGEYMTFDISWLSNRVSKIISVKGDVSEKPITIDIPKYNNKFAVKYDGGDISYSGISASYTGKIQWRLNGSSVWKETTIDPSKDTELIDSLASCQNPNSSTIVYFRMASVNGTSEANTGLRPSNESRIVLPKLSGIAPVEVDNEAKNVKIAKYVSYRKIGDSEWSEPAASEKNISLSELIESNGSYPGNGDYIVEFKVSSEDSKYSKAYIRVRATSPSDIVAMNISQPKTDKNPVTSMATENVTSAAISVTATDYDAQYIDVDTKLNPDVLYSTDKENWYSAENGCVNISWIDNTDIKWFNPNEKKVYIKGTYCVKDEDIIEVAIPEKTTGFKAVFDRTSSAEAPKINISGVSDVTQIQWRKNQSYKWNTISASEKGEFIDKAFENLRVKSGKIIVRAAASNGKRPSNECTTIIARRASMPNVRFNSVSMSVNTTTLMEYYDETTKKWTTCTKGMNIWSFPAAKTKAKATSGIDGSDISIQIRKKATSNNGYSKVKHIYLEGQKVAPSISVAETADIRYSQETKTSAGVKKKYHTLKFNKATVDTPYQYVLVAKGGKFDETKANWKTVEAPVTVTLKGDKAVSGSKIYVRIKGANANFKKNTPAKIPSEANSFDIP